MFRQNVIPDNSLIQSTCKITHGQNTGTCFQYIHLEGKIGTVFLVTVKHLFLNIQSGTQVTIGITTDNGLNQITGTIYFHQNLAVDIGLIKISKPLFPYFKFYHNTFAIGQQSFFCGFPYGFAIESVGINNGYPLPLVKRASISAYSPKLQLFTFDGHNNPGFSGSPIGFHDLDKKETHIIGIVYSYHGQTNTINIGANTVTYSENSGIFFAYSFALVFEIINQMKTQSLLDV